MARPLLRFLLVGFILVALDAQSVLARDAKACAVSIGQCPEYGCAAEADGPDGLLNQRKRTFPTADTPTVLTLDDFEALQARADALFHTKKNLDAAARDLLKNLRVATPDVFVSEGDFVQIAGYLVGLPQRPKAEGPESVNCNLNDPRNHTANDFHIPVARAATDTEYDGIVVEMIPQQRPGEWSIEAIRQIARDGLPMIVRGQLMYDNKHRVNKDPNNDNGQPKRFSLWEVHPVTEFYVCRKDSCDPANIDEWELVGKVQP